MSRLSLLLVASVVVGGLAVPVAENVTSATQSAPLVTVLNLHDKPVNLVTLNTGQKSGGAKNLHYKVQPGSSHSFPEDRRCNIWVSEDGTVSTGSESIIEYKVDKFGSIVYDVSHV